MITSSDQWTLGKLFYELGGVRSGATTYLRRGGLEYVPEYFHSWRGSYEMVSLSYIGRQNYIDAYEVYRKTEKAIGGVFEGWKGGSFSMTDDTPVFADAEGEYEGYGVYNLINVAGDCVILADKVNEWTF